MQQEILPWVKQSFSGGYTTIDYGRMRHGRSYDPGRFIRSITQYLDDNPIMASRKGDIVKFNDGFFHRQHSDWRGWFVTKKDQKRFWERNPAVARWARNQLGMIVGRYRKVKFKYRIFADYGAVVMLLTGPRIGHVRHYYSAKPFNVICPFEKRLTYKTYRKRLSPEMLDVLDAPYEDTNEGRNLLVSRFYYGLRGA